LAFKDFGARFHVQLLGYFAKQQKNEIIILVATSEIRKRRCQRIFRRHRNESSRLVPFGKVSDIQEKQFTTLGNNVTALEVEWHF
jgi:threonine synthase